MKSCFFHIILLFLLLPAVAQQSSESIDIYSGPELNMTNNINVPMLFGHDQAGYYAFAYDYREAIMFFNKELDSKHWNYLSLMDGPRKKTLLAMYHFHDSLYMFTSDERTTRMLLYVETIDKKTLTQNGDIRLLMDVKNMAGWNAEFRFKLSRQEKKLLIYSSLDVLTKKIQDLHFEMFGEGMNLEWEADQRIVYRGRHPRESIIKVGDNGDAFVISLKDDQGIKSLWQEIKNRYTLVAVTDNGKYTNAYTLNLPELYIRGVQIEPGGEHDLSCAGFYSPTHSRSMVDGIFYFDLDNKSGEFKNRKLYEFEPWFMEEAIAGKLRKEPEELFDYRVRQLIRRNNGDLFFIAENEFDQDYDTYQNIIVASFGPGGTENWKRIIPKRQGFDNHEAFNYSSYSVHAPWYMDKVYLVFNDHHKNGEWPDEKKIKSFHPNDKANLRIVGVGPAGELSSKIIYRKTRKNMKTPIPLQNYDMLNHEMIIPALRYKRYNFHKISFNE